MPDKPASPGGAGHGQPHVLVVEDDPGVRSTMRLVLEMEGCRVSTASNMAESLAEARANAGISALVVDYNLRNDERGTDVVRSVRAILGDAVNALLLTGDTTNAADEAAQAAGLAMLRKPISLEQLLDFVRGKPGERGGRVT